tara:strand:+ start:2921 stop:3700 length:780 start_codon:yes stop_codon:yes gene_type:complete
MLNDIIKNKIKEIDLLRESQKLSFDEACDLKYSKRSFIGALQSKINDGKNAIIAEIKRCSPSKGYLNKNLNIENMADIYEKSDASCISVLTDSKFFKGSIDDLINIKQKTNLPVLRKDFILDESQLIQSCMIGSDCILLIIACLSENQFSNLLEKSKILGLDVLVEVHNENELKLALKYKCNLIGINNRNLATFEVNLDTSKKLARLIDTRNTLIVSESGIDNKGTIDDLNKNGIKTFLIGESLIVSPSPGDLLKSLVG